MVFAAFIALASLVACWLAVYALGFSLRDDIRLKAPALEYVVFPLRSFWVLNVFPPWSPFAVLAARAAVVKAHPEFEPQFRRFRLFVYLWFVSLFALAASVYLCSVWYGS